MTTATILKDQVTEELISDNDGFYDEANVLWIKGSIE